MDEPCMEKLLDRKRGLYFFNFPLKTGGVGLNLYECELCLLVGSVVESGS